MGQADLSPPKRLRFGVVVLVLLMHVAVIFGLIRAFAPDLSAQVVRTVVTALTVTVTSPAPSPPPEASAKAAPEEEGAAAAAGKKARPKEVAAPEPKIAIAETQAPQVASTGNDVSSGARDQGEGSGAGGAGAGTGSGQSGSGQGGGGGTKAEKIAGDINSARDYPKKSRDLRIGDHVIVALTVGTDGRVKHCRIYRPSRDPEADRITCKLASERFRFKPATDASGRPVESIYGWKQRWFYPGKK